jgi:hypothetical protein
MNAEQHVAAADHGLVDICELQDIGRAVPVLDDRLHDLSLLESAQAIASPQTVGASHGDDDLSSSASLFQVTDGLANLA